MGGGGGGHQALLLAAHQPRVLSHAGHGLVSVGHLVAITPDNLILTSAIEMRNIYRMLP